MLRKLSIAAGLLALSFQLAHAGDIVQGELAPVDVKPAVIVKGGHSAGKMTVGWFGTISPKWLDPLTASQAISTTNNFKYLIQDALIKSMPQGLLTYSLADKVEVSKDYRTFGFRLRAGLKFQDGEPLTSADVKWTYEHYSGVNSHLFKDMTASVDTPDAQTVVIHLKNSTPDFLYLYSGASTTASIGWIVPEHYYEKVGAAGYLQHPVGAGPFKFVSQEGGTSLTLEAWDGYWRRAPGVKSLVFKSVQSPSTGVAGVKTGELDLFTNAIPLAREVMRDKGLRYDANLTGAWLLTFPNYEDPASPFHDKRVREAVSLALNRAFLSQQGTEGAGKPFGNWVTPENPGVVNLPVPAYDPAKAKKLLAEAGYANGLKIDGLMPFFVEPQTGERFLESIAAIGIHGSLKVVDAPQYFATVGRGRKGFQSKSTILMFADQVAGPASMMTSKYALCSSPVSFICEPKIEALWKDYNATLDIAKRREISGEIQKIIIGDYLVIPTYLNSFMQIVGPRVLPAGNAPDGQGFHKYWAAPLTPWPWPWEDWQVKS